MDRVEIGEGCRLRKTIVDKDVVIPSGAMVGCDTEADRRRFTVTASGGVVVPKGVPSSGRFWEA